MFALVKESWTTTNKLQQDYWSQINQYVVVALLFTCYSLTLHIPNKITM